VLAKPIPGNLTQPQYPQRARERGIQGRVALKARVNTQGQVVAINIVGSSGHAELDQAALKAVQTWRFTPAKSGTQAIDSWVTVPINFALK
jgi:protein TonB